jgi:drug/metabolite transporter (DMT)-like permease
LSRLQADLALAFASLIWGFGFVAQKWALDDVGPFTFVAVRFLISALFVLPFVWGENGLSRLSTALNYKNASRLLMLGGFFSTAVILQQYGLKAATVTNTAFLTSLYIILVPIVGRIFHRQKLSQVTLLAGLLSVLGIWLLSGGSASLTNISIWSGDGMVILCAIGFAAQVTIVGRLAKRLMLPFTLSLIQYLCVGLVALILAMFYEHIELQALLKAWKPILFAAIASGGIAYTLQAVAQQHTPSADAAIIMSLEALFGAVGGIWLLGERLSLQGFMGCGAILLAIVLVELAPILRQSRKGQVTNS